MREPDVLDLTMTVEQLWQPAPGGSGTYVAELARALADRPDVRLTGLTARHAGPPASGLPASMRLHASALPRPAMYELWHRARRAPRITPGRGGVVHATTWAVPPVRGPLVVTVHDLAFLRSPEHFTPRGNAFFRRALDVVRREADVVVVPSSVTADDCVEHGIARDRLAVVPHGVRVPSTDADDVERFRARYGLERPYLLWCGTVEPRKNLAGLLGAYAQLLPGTELDLVLVGPVGWGDAGAEVTRLAAGLPAERVHRLGRLDEAGLHAAYAGARVFCYPSTWEGFGMPVVEAMAHGVPVVTSSGTSMADLVAAGGGVLADPRDPGAIARAVQAAAGARHDDLSAAARTTAAGFTWARSAELHMAAYRRAATS